MSEETYGWILVGIICLVSAFGCYVWGDLFREWFWKETD